MIVNAKGQKVFFLENVKYYLFNLLDFSFNRVFNKKGATSEGTVINTGQWGGISRTFQISCCHPIFLKIVVVVMNVDGSSQASRIACFLFAY